MRAVRVHEFGGPEVLRVEEVPWPHPDGDQLLIRVHASSVNGTDVHLRQASGPLALTLRRPFTLGFDVAGEVVGVGPRVTAFEPGDRVFALLGHGGGGAAEYAVVRQSHAALAPLSISWVEAAAVPLAGLTALQALRGLGGTQLRPGARVLVYGASGGIGAFGVMLARHFGAHVIGVARASKLDFVRSLGADEVIATEELDLRTLTGAFDLIFDTPPALEFAQARVALKPDGVMLTTRPIPTSPGEALAFLRRTGPRLAGVRTAERGQDLAYLARLIDAGALRVPLDRTFALEDAVAAHRYLDGPDVRGKVVLTVGD